MTPQNKGAIASVVAAGTAITALVLMGQHGPKLDAPTNTPVVVQNTPAVNVARPVYLPDPARTPGAVNPNVSPNDIAGTIGKSGWTATVRPPTSYTNALKRKQLASGYAVNGDMNPADYEEDHCIPIELLGNPTDERNLWPALWHYNVNGYDYGMKTKDVLETKLKRLVVAGKLPLPQAQKEIAADWVSAYKKYVSPTLPKYGHQPN